MSEKTTYSAAPFISKDGPDKDGVRAEVRVVKGFGHVDTIDEGAKATKVSFAVSNTKWKSSGYVPNTEEKLLALVREAQESGEPIYFRIETVRKTKLKEGFDRSTPIDVLAPPKNADMARENIHRSFAAAKREDDEKWTISSVAVTNMDEDYKYTNDATRPSANDLTLEELEAFDKSSKPATQETANSAPSGSSYDYPFAIYNRDGELNAGSQAVAVPIAMYCYVSDYIRDHSLADVITDEKEKVAVVNALLRAANRAQMGIYEGKLKKPDYMAASHTRARNLVFEIVRTHYPITGELFTNSEARKQWCDQVTKKAVGMWQWSMGEVRKVYGE